MDSLAFQIDPKQQFVSEYQDFKTEKPFESKDFFSREGVFSDLTSLISKTVSSCCKHKNDLIQKLTDENKFLRKQVSALQSKSSSKRGNKPSLNIKRFSKKIASKYKNVLDGNK